MRLRNSLFQMGFAIFVAILLMVEGQFSLAVLFIIIHLVWVLFGDRQTINGEKNKKALAEKYPPSTMPDTKYVVSDKTVVLKDSFVKEALLGTIVFTDYSSRNRQDKELLDQFYSTVMAGGYVFCQYFVTKKEIVPGNDSPTEYRIYSNQKEYKIMEHVFNKCSVGDCLVEITVKGMPCSSIIIWLNTEDDNHLVARTNSFYQFKYLGLRTGSDAN